MRIDGLRHTALAARLSTLDADAISVSAGGVQTMSLDAGPTHANDLYLVLGTLGPHHAAVVVDPLLGTLLLATGAVGVEFQP